MIYIECLIRRALAVPRDQAESLFDPFDQIAPWPLDESAPATTTSSLGVKLSEQTESTVAQPHAELLRQLKIPSTQPLNSQETPSSQTTVQAVAAIKKSDLAASQKQVQASSILPVKEQTHSSLERADAFMRTLGIQPTAPEPSAPFNSSIGQDVRESVVSHAQAMMVRPESKSTQSSGFPDSAHPVLVRPVQQSTPLAVSPSPMQKKNSQKKGQSAAAADENPAQAKSRSTTPTPPVIERVVQNTVVVTSSSPRHDDLAHSSGISRFGIGQL